MGEGVELLQKMLIFAPNKRITAKQILSDKWFDEIREEMIEQFGNVYPHCGSKQYQLQKFREKQEERNKNKEENEENIDPINEYDDDYDYNVDGIESIKKIVIINLMKMKINLMMMILMILQE